MHQYIFSHSVIRRSRKTKRFNNLVCKFYLIFLLCVLISTVLIFTLPNFYQDYFLRGVKKQLATKGDEVGCRIPQLDPFDESVFQFINYDPPVLNCTRHFPLLYTLNETSFLIQLIPPRRFGLSKCCYRKITRIRGNDNSVGISKSCTPINSSTTRLSSQDEFISISCFYNKTGKSIFMDILGTVPLTNELKLRTKIQNRYKIGNEKSKQFNVVILGLDSVSHMHFIRIMPKSYEFLTKTLGAIGMNGYNKIGYNTYPNVVPMLTGLSEQEFDAYRTSHNHSFFDESLFLWKDFAAQGFVTGFGEDAPGISIFNYQKQGFNNSPVDYYRRPLSLVQEKFIGHYNYSEENLCYGPRLGFEVSMNFIKHMSFTMQTNGLKYFQFVWATSLFHAHLNIGKHGDVILYDTLQYLRNKEYLKNTIVILMSDHGARYGKIRQTTQGRIEDMKPFLYFILPKGFKQLYPEAVENLKRNANTLSTPFDLHATLKDVLENGNLKSSRIHERSNSIKNKIPRAISLFLHIPKSRNCNDAQIPLSYCVCDTKEDVEISNDLVKSAADFIVKEINNILKPYKQCRNLSLGEITMASVILRSKSINKINEKERDDLELDIGLTVLPSNATFEVGVKKKVGNNEEISWSISDISRTNLYGKQSDCVSDYYVKQFCYCSE